MIETTWITKTVDIKKQMQAVKEFLIRECSAERISEKIRGEQAFLNWHYQMILSRWRAQEEYEDLVPQHKPGMHQDIT